MSDQERDGSPDNDEQPVQLVPVRRRPNIIAFVLTGAVIGIIAAVVIANVSNGDGNYSVFTTFGYFAVIFGGLGALLGGLVGALLDRR
ncbi:hypothetical protein [Calidifontibacter indicus]|uniref:hypothetical protein n=1 Tax=Calidifontibacter indicus TaxID=419650 RepID=UPI003D74DA9F